MKERLIELLDKKQVCGWKYVVDDYTTDVFNEDIADYLLDNGVIVLPCAVGEPIYQIVYCRCGNPQYYEAKQCMKRTTKSTPKVYGQTMELQMGKKLVCDVNYGLKTAYVPKGTICHKIYQKPFSLKMIDEVGKSVFLTLEEAKKALERSEGK